MKSEDKKRVFIGIPLPGNVADQFGKFSGSVADHPEIKWVPRWNLHFTVVFIGEMVLEEIILLSEKLKPILADFKSFELDFYGLSLHPKRNPYMIWAKFLPNPEFTSLVGTCSGVIHPEKKLKPNPLPHVTLARFKKLSQPVSLENDLGKCSFIVKNLVLWESILRPEGAEYIPLQEFKLKES